MTMTVEHHSSPKQEIKEREKLPSPRGVNLLDGHFFPVEDWLLAEKTNIFHENEEAPSPRGVQMFGYNSTKSISAFSLDTEHREQRKSNDTDDHYFPVEWPIEERKITDENEETPLPSEVYMLDRNSIKHANPICRSIEHSEKPKSNDNTMSEHLEADPLPDCEEHNDQVNNEITYIEKNDQDKISEHLEVYPSSELKERNNQLQHQEITYLEKNDQDIRIAIRIVSKDDRVPSKHEGQPSGVKRQKKSVTFLGSDPVSKRIFYKRGSIPKTPPPKSFFSLNFCTNRVTNQVRSILKKTAVGMKDESLTNNKHHKKSAEKNTPDFMGPWVSKVAQCAILLEKSMGCNAVLSSCSMLNETA